MRRSSLEQCYQLMNTIGNPHRSLSCQTIIMSVVARKRTEFVSSTPLGFVFMATDIDYSQSPSSRIFASPHFTIERFALQEFMCKCTCTIDPWPRWFRDADPSGYVKICWDPPSFFDALFDTDCFNQRFAPFRLCFAILMSLECRSHAYRLPYVLSTYAFPNKL